MCAMHYSRWRKYGTTGDAEMRRAENGSNTVCSVDGCETAAHARRLCPAHLARWRKYGDPLGTAPLHTPKTIEQLRLEAYEGRTGGQSTPSGYRYRTLKRGMRYAEHRLVMEHIIGRALYPDENVHHINGDRSDNRPENLELWSTWQPAGQRVEDKIKWAHELLARYEPG